MNYGQIVLVVFALFIETGGIIAYLLKKSKPSLIAGAVSGGVLIIAFVVTFFRLSLGLWIGAVVGLLLCIVFGIRLARTRKFMPSGMLLLVSAVASAVLVVAALRSAPPAP